MKGHLIIGITGLTGEHLRRVLIEAKRRVYGTYHQHAVRGFYPLDITKRSNVRALIKKIRPAFIYLPAAMINVDYCETHQQESYAINVEGPSHVADAANEVGAKLIYFSTDFIFDGKHGPYKEKDLARPLNEYGRQKLASEHYMALNSRDYLIVRTTMIFGWEFFGNNLVYRLCRSISACRPFNVPMDQIGNPTYATDLARATAELVDAGAKGVYHVVGRQRMSRYEFALEAAKIFHLDSRFVRPMPTSRLGQVAPRPLGVGMVTDKMNEVIQYRPKNFKEGLKAMSHEISF